MRQIELAEVKRWARRTALTVLAVLAVGSMATVWLWRDRASLDDIDWPPYPHVEPSLDAVTMTWLGVTTLLFDDGETQILIDGFFSRPTLLDALLSRPVESDAATINYVLDEYRMRQLLASLGRGRPISTTTTSPASRHRACNCRYRSKTLPTRIRIWPRC